MSQEIKDEALEQIEKDVLMGFESAEDMIESIAEMFEEEDDFDEDWLAETIEAYCNEHRDNSFNWSKPTDFDRLDAAFTELIKQKIVCLHNAGYTKQDAIGDCEEAIDALDDIGIEAIGYCYYHNQDLQGAIDPTSRTLLLGYDSFIDDSKETLMIANAIVAVLKAHHFAITWNGTIQQRIQIDNINWQKVPDDKDWSMGRVIDILSESEK
jgi:hypothetical protein